MVKQIIGSVITLAIGGTAYTVSQHDVVTNLTSNSGMTQQQAQQYVNNLKPSDLASFSKIGAGYVTDGNAIQSANVDCTNYTYKWESSSLSCDNGKMQLQALATDEIALGNCYQALDTNLGSSSKAKINECITDIDAVGNDYNQPIVAVALDQSAISDYKNTNAYNKSVLQAAVAR